MDDSKKTKKHLLAELADLRRLLADREKADAGPRRAEEEPQGSEERYQSLFHDNHAVMLIINPETAAIVDANPSACAYYGWSYEEITRMKISDINTLPRKEIFSEMRKARDARRNYFVFRHRLASGEVRDVEVFSGSVRYKGQPLLCSIVHDITERKRIEKALRQSEEKFSKTFHVSGSMMALSTLNEGRILDVNDAYLKTLGFSREEVIGKTTLELKIFRNSTDRDVLIKEIAETGKIINSEVAIQAKNGSLRYGLVSVEPISIENETHLLTTMTDITERKRTEEEREILIGKLQDAIANVKVLSGLLPICASCKKIRDDRGNWHQIESYIKERTEAEFSHGICPECMKTLYPDYGKDK